MFRWDDLRLLLAVHREGSLAAAGRALGVDASTASRRLRSFEEAVGTLLFDRTPDGLRATAVAVRLLPHAEETEAAALAAEAAVAGVDLRAEGRVRFACADAFAVYVVAPRVTDFVERWPGIQLEILASPRLLDLARREADVAVRFRRPTQGDLVARRVTTTGGYCAFVHRNYIERGGSLEPDELRWVGWSADQSHLPEAQLYQRLVGRPPI